MFNFLLVMALFVEFLWFGMGPSFQSRPRIGESFRRVERMAALRRDMDEQTTESSIAYEKEWALLTVHHERTWFIMHACIGGLLVGGICFCQFHLRRLSTRKVLDTAVEYQGEPGKD